MGVSVFSGWENPRSEYGKVPGTQCPWQYPWDALQRDDRIPLMGRYNEADPWVTEQRCEMMAGGWASLAFRRRLKKGKRP